MVEDYKMADNSKKTVLIVDDNQINRLILSKVLTNHYHVLEAENGKVALDILSLQKDNIIAIMLDLMMPVMDGFEVLKRLRNDEQYVNLPIVVTTGSGNNDSEKQALSLGAWDFVTKPYDADIILFRLNNAIERSQYSALQRLKYLSEYDALTGIYNKTKFFDATRNMLDAFSNERFVFLRFDVDRFQLINSFFGTEEGDKLLIYICDNLAKDGKSCEKATYGRIESDVVAFCTLYDKENIETIVRLAKKKLALFNLNYDIVPSIGLYVIDDRSISVEEMYNRATLAAKTCKGNYVGFYAYYNESMSAAINAEQEITNDMNSALEKGEFQIYIQPQYNIHTNLPCGGEALVRWFHPNKGLVLPSVFIPIFERNGFITKLDYYVWEQACKLLHHWIEQGKNPYPLSVNISRVNVYNPNLVEMLLGLVYRYQLEPSLLNLELTESAYTDSPIAMKKVMSQLQSNGFVVMMDDFGSGYSSLSLLKDIMIDVLKIDMRFLSVTEFPGRGENIIASIIRMAKWLKIPVIAEGAETIEQVDFLRSVGCDYVQGFYYALPMPAFEYEQLCDKLKNGVSLLMDQKTDYFDYDELFSLAPDMKMLFGSALQAAVIYEFADNQIEPIRVNDAYYALLGHDDMLRTTSNLLDLVKSEYIGIILKTFTACVNNQSVFECEYERACSDGKEIWIQSKLHYVATVGSKHIIIGELTDISMRRELEVKLRKYEQNEKNQETRNQTILIVDDIATNRMILMNMLQEHFFFLEAENGEEAIKILLDNPNQVDLILLDINMPVMDGNEFMKYKNNKSNLEGIPVIMVTDEDSTLQQTQAFSLGADDYIVKPFVEAVVKRRIDNVLKLTHRFKEMVHAYNSVSQQVNIDQMTGLINRVSAQEMITQQLACSQGTCVMVMLDIDNFKEINERNGHDYGDKVLFEVGKKMRHHFRKNDIVARMGGDEFAAFVRDIPDVAGVKEKAKSLCNDIASIKIAGENASLSCSLGLALSSSIYHSFDILYHQADKALYSAKCQGNNNVSLYGEENMVSIHNWIHDAKMILDDIKDCVYVCDKDTYELIYANKSLCQAMNVNQYQCVGKKCYEILMHKHKPCDFCFMKKIGLNKMHTCLFRGPDQAHVFLMRGENIKHNDKIFHIEIAIDVSDIDPIKLKQNEVKAYESK
ncbi:MAG: EAL domain-containing protein [Erysipelotrichaceae bacterium]